MPLKLARALWSAPPPVSGTLILAAGVVKASLSDIKQGLFVGVTAMPRADGSQSALEVHNDQRER
jgi:hypothetical protein